MRRVTRAIQAILITGMIGATAIFSLAAVSDSATETVPDATCEEMLRIQCGMNNARGRRIAALERELFHLRRTLDSLETENRRLRDRLAPTDGSLDPQPEGGQEPQGRGRGEAQAPHAVLPGVEEEPLGLAEVGFAQVAAAEDGSGEGGGAEIALREPALLEAALLETTRREGSPAEIDPAQGAGEKARPRETETR